MWTVIVIVLFINIIIVFRVIIILGGEWFVCSLHIFIVIVLMVVITIW